MSTTPSLSARKVIQKLKKIGFIETHQRGSHLYLKNNINKIVTIPIHGSKDIPVETLRNIVIKQAGITMKDFIDL